MKRFLLKILFAAVFALVVAFLIVVIHVAQVPKDVRVAFAIPSGTEVVFIGNSHTGCSFYEAPEFRNRVVWKASAGFLFHYFRFLELERRGAFDQRVKICVLDCGRPAMNGFHREKLKEDFALSFPFAWRYINQIPMPNFILMGEVLLHAGERFSILTEVSREGRDWTTRTAEERKAYFENLRIYAGCNPICLDGGAFPSDWMSLFLQIVRDLKARCERHGIRLVFVATPLASEDPTRTNPIIEKRVSDCIERIRAQGIEFHDLRSAEPDNHFLDTQHLLRSASYEFTKKFYAEVLKLPVGE